MTIKQLYPTVKPAADFNFAATKTLDPRISFSRASSAKYYDGKTFAKAEENLWIGSTTIALQTLVAKTDNAAISPDGFQMCLLVPSTANDWHLGGYLTRYLYSDLEYVFSFVAKANGYSKVRFGDFALNRFQGTIDLATTTVSATGGPLFLSASAVALADGYVRVIIKLKSVGASVASSIAITPFADGAIVDNYGRASFAGDGVSGVYFGEFQLEQRSDFSFHVPTTMTAVSNWMPVLLTAPAGVPRFLHDPVTGKSLGFLSERQTTNLTTWSEFGGASIYTGVAGTGVTASTMFGPDGNLVTAARYVSGADGFVYKGSATASTAHTLSVYVRMDDGGAPNPGSLGSSFDFSLVIGGVRVDGTALVVKHEGNNLYRVSGTLTTGVINLGNNGVIKYSIQSSRGFRTTGWQLEANGKATSYIKTEGSQVTRLADNATIGGAALDSFYNQRGGTFVADCILSTRGTNLVFGMAFGNSIAERMNVFTAGTTGLTADNYINNTASGGASVVGGVSDNQRHVIVRRCADYSWATCVNGGTVSTSTSGQIGRKDRLGIGAPGYGAADRLDGPIARLAYYDELLTDAQLQALTRI